MSVCLSGRLLCQAGERVGKCSTHLGIKLMCWDQGPENRKLFLWLKAIIGMGSEWALAAMMAEKPNTCRSRVPGPINTYISIYPVSLPVVISVINNSPKWCVGRGTAENLWIGAVEWEWNETLIIKYKVLVVKCANYNSFSTLALTNTSIKFGVLYIWLSIRGMWCDYKMILDASWISLPLEIYSETWVTSNFSTD